MNTRTAELIFSDFQRISPAERQKFFNLLAERAFRDEDNCSHEELFGDLRDAYFTANEAIEYLEISMATFRRYIRDGKISSSTEVGNSKLFLADDLRRLKAAMKLVKG
ncbi:MAG: DNA-binding protein [Betaproteobacteria bacterium]|nr:MAG: DNA-binding protein [Betaproteobacteria bacterium]